MRASTSPSTSPVLAPQDLATATSTITTTVQQDSQPAQKVKKEPTASTSQPAQRSRITVVCTECKRLKLKCDRGRPCQQCKKKGRPQFCGYQQGAAEKVDVQTIHTRTVAIEDKLVLLTETVEDLAGRRNIAPPLPRFPADHEEPKPRPFDSLVLLAFSNLDLNLHDAKPWTTHSFPTSRSRRLQNALDRIDDNLFYAGSAKERKLQTTLALAALIPKPMLPVYEDIHFALESTLLLHPLSNSLRLLSHVKVTGTNIAEGDTNLLSFAMFSSACALAGLNAMESSDLLTLKDVIRWFALSFKALDKISISSASTPTDLLLTCIFQLVFLLHFFKTSADCDSFAVEMVDKVVTKLVHCAGVVEGVMNRIPIVSAPGSMFLREEGKRLCAAVGHYVRVVQIWKSIYAPHMPKLTFSLSSMGTEQALPSIVDDRSFLENSNRPDLPACFGPSGATVRNEIVFGCGYLHYRTRLDKILAEMERVFTYALELDQAKRAEATPIESAPVNPSVATILNDPKSSRNPSAVMVLYDQWNNLCRFYENLPPALQLDPPHSPTVPAPAPASSYPNPSYSLPLPTPPSVQGSNSKANWQRAELVVLGMEFLLQLALPLISPPNPTPDPTLLTVCLKAVDTLGDALAIQAKCKLAPPPVTGHSPSATNGHTSSSKQSHAHPHSTRSPVNETTTTATGGRGEEKVLMYDWRWERRIMMCSVVWVRLALGGELDLKQGKSKSRFDIPIWEDAIKSVRELQPLSSMRMTGATTTSSADVINTGFAIVDKGVERILKENERRLVERERGGGSSKKRKRDVDDEDEDAEGEVADPSGALTSPVNGKNTTAWIVPYVPGPWVVGNPSTLGIAQEDEEDTEEFLSAATIEVVNEAAEAKKKENIRADLPSDVSSATSSGSSSIDRPTIKLEFPTNTKEGGKGGKKSRVLPLQPNKPSKRARNDVPKRVESVDFGVGGFDVPPIAPAELESLREELSPEEIFTDIGYQPDMELISGTTAVQLTAPPILPQSHTTHNVLLPAPSAGPIPSLAPIQDYQQYNVEQPQHPQQPQQRIGSTASSSTAGSTGYGMQVHGMLKEDEEMDLSGSYTAPAPVSAPMSADSNTSTGARFAGYHHQQQYQQQQQHHNHQQHAYASSTPLTTPQSAYPGNAGSIPSVPPTPVNMYGHEIQGWGTSAGAANAATMQASHSAHSTHSGHSVHDTHVTHATHSAHGGHVNTSVQGHPGQGSYSGQPTPVSATANNSYSHQYNDYWLSGKFGQGQGQGQAQQARAPTPAELAYQSQHPPPPQSAAQHAHAHAHQHQHQHQHQQPLLVSPPQPQQQQQPPQPQQHYTPSQHVQQHLNQSTYQQPQQPNHHQPQSQPQHFTSGGFVVPSYGYVDRGNNAQGVSGDGIIGLQYTNSAHLVHPEQPGRAKTLRHVGGVQPAPGIPQVIQQTPTLMSQPAHQGWVAADGVNAGYGAYQGHHMDQRHD